MEQFIFEFEPTAAIYIVESTDRDTAEEKLIEHLRKVYDKTELDLVAALNHNITLFDHHAGIRELNSSRWRIDQKLSN